jgi:MFS transporter, MHS family, proline/betaine transporter
MSILRASTPADRRARSAVIYGSAGTVVEWFDYGLYLYLVPVMAPLFFPSDEAIVSAIASLGVFAAGSIMRIAGGAFFGSLGDRLGCKKALVLCITMMTVPLALTAFLPVYAVVGIAAPLLFTAMRLLQGFSAGGEYSGTIVQLVEQARAGRRGFVASTAVFTSGIGIILASALVASLTTWTSADFMSDWGWRICCLVGGALGLFAFVMRRKMPETEEFLEGEREGDIPKQPLRYALTHLPKQVIIAALLAGYGGILYYGVLGFVPTILDSFREVQSDEALWVTTGMALVYAIATPAFGALSDRYGRKRTLMAGAIGFVFLSAPMLWLMTSQGLIIIILGGLVLLVMLMLYTGPVVAAIGEEFPSKARYSALAVGYNLGSAVLGGPAPLVAALLIDWFDTPVAASFLLIIASVIAIPLLWRMKDRRDMTMEQINAEFDRG